MQALAQWHHPVASSKAQDVRYRAMRPAMQLRIRMGIKNASIWHVCFVVVDLIVDHNHRLYIVGFN